MSDVMVCTGTFTQWQGYVQPVAKLFQALPVPANACVVVMLDTSDVGDVSGAKLLLAAVAAAIGCKEVALPVHAAQPEVEQMLAQHQPTVVVCAPAVFGWVSKLAFLAGCVAIYTCAEDGAGTLLDRASHFLA